MLGLCRCVIQLLWSIRYGLIVISAIRILLINARDYVIWDMWIALWLVPIQTVCLNVEELWATVLKVIEKSLNKDLKKVFWDCPCHVNCPNGCSDCPNPICVCGENSTPQNELNLEACKKEKSIDLGSCIIACNNDQGCENSCIETFKTQYDDCPCQVRVLP